MINEEIIGRHCISAEGRCGVLPAGGHPFTDPRWCGGEALASRHDHRRGPVSALRFVLLFKSFLFKFCFRPAKISGVSAAIQLAQKLVKKNKLAFYV